MTTVAILFWAGVFLVFYTYLGYGILLWLLVKPCTRHGGTPFLPTRPR